MSLAAIENAMAQTLWLQPGYGALLSVETFQNYLDQLEPDAKAALENIPVEKLYFYQHRLHYSVEDILSLIYPYTKSLLADVWYDVVETYRRFYPNRSYRVFGGAGALIDFLATQTRILQCTPFIVDLARYEWLEFEIVNRPDFWTPPGFTPVFPETSNACHTQKPFWNPVRVTTYLEYPIPNVIHQIKAIGQVSPVAHQGASLWKVMEVDPSPTPVLIYRDPETLEARFFVLNALSAKLLPQKDTDVSYLSLVEELYANEPVLQTMDKPRVILEAFKFFEECLKNRILLGSLQ